MVDRCEGDRDRLSPITGEREGDDLSAGRAKSASEGFSADSDDDFGLFGGEFHEGIVEGQDDVVESVASRQVVTRSRLDGRDAVRRHERVAHTRVAHADEVGTDGNNRPGDAVTSEGAEGDRSSTLGQVQEDTAEGGLLGRGFLEPAPSGASPGCFVDLAIRNPPLERRQRVAECEIDWTIGRLRVGVHGSDPTQGGGCPCRCSAQRRYARVTHGCALHHHPSPWQSPDGFLAG